MSYTSYKHYQNQYIPSLPSYIPSYIPTTSNTHYTCHHTMNTSNKVTNCLKTVPISNSILPYYHSLISKSITNANHSITPFETNGLFNASSIHFIYTTTNINSNKYITSNITTTNSTVQTIILFFVCFYIKILFFNHNFFFTPFGIYNSLHYM